MGCPPLRCAARAVTHSCTYGVAAMSGLLTNVPAVLPRTTASAPVPGGPRSSGAVFLGPPSRPEPWSINMLPTCSSSSQRFLQQPRTPPCRPLPQRRCGPRAPAAVPPTPPPPAAGPRQRGAMRACWRSRPSWRSCHGTGATRGASTPPVRPPACRRCTRDVPTLMNRAALAMAPSLSACAAAAHPSPSPAGNKGVPMKDCQVSVVPMRPWAPARVLRSPDTTY